MTLSFDCFWSFRSPYSDLLTPRLVALERDYDVRCVVRIVRPLAVRQPEFFSNGDPLWVSYLMRDTVRTARFDARRAPRRPAPRLPRHRILNRRPPPCPAAETDVEDNGRRPFALAEQRPARQRAGGTS